MQLKIPICNQSVTTRVLIYPAYQTGVCMESYIVRIYRRDETDTAWVDGMVEAAETKQTTSFHTLEELVSIFSKKVSANMLKDAGNGASP